MGSQNQTTQAFESHTCFRVVATLLGLRLAVHRLLASGELAAEEFEADGSRLPKRTPGRQAPV